MHSNALAHHFVGVTNNVNAIQYDMRASFAAAALVTKAMLLVTNVKASVFVLFPGTLKNQVLLEVMRRCV